MDKNKIADLLEENHQKLFDWLSNQTADNWEFGPNNKWNINKHIHHLVDSLQLLNNALSFPRFVLKYKFGTNNRECRDYETVVKNYRKKLKENNEKVISFNKANKKPLLKDKKRLLTLLQIQQKKLQYKTKKISEKNLDTLVIPHPLMGKMTVREIIMWTAYHTEHHLEILKKYY